MLLLREHKFMPSIIIRLIDGVLFGRKELRINKFIAECGVCSRRAAEELISEGKVLVNNKPAAIGMDIDPENDRVTCEGKRIRIKAADKRYFMFYKPRGVITSMKAQDDRSVISELIKGIKGRVYPVGRLDRDSEGLLILTDDGELAQKLSHPSHHIPKTYRVTISGKVTNEHLDKIRRGISLDDDTVTLPADVQIHAQGDDRTVLHITLYEGKNRQIRRMCEELNLNIMLLKRIAVGEVNIGHMQPGQYRPLSHSEATKLCTAVGMKPPVFKKFDNKKGEMIQKNRNKTLANKTSNERRFEKQLKDLNKSKK